MSSAGVPLLSFSHSISVSFFLSFLLRLSTRSSLVTLLETSSPANYLAAAAAAAAA